MSVKRKVDSSLQKKDEAADILEVRDVAEDVLSEVSRIIIGYGDILHYLFIALLVNGHVLLEGVPGLAKTVTAKTFADSLGISFKRIQFTPDLLPSDITGSMVFDQSKNEFVIRKGPLFANLVLADEINRTAPKTQSALLEAMAEKQVTIEGKTYDLPAPFVVVATQNPIEQEGTYPLPEAQLDRFLFKLFMGYVTPDEEVEVMRRQLTGEKINLDKITTGEEIVKLQRAINNVYIDEIILEYIQQIIGKIRNDPQVAMGAGPRALLTMMKSAKARAAILGRDYVTPDDVRELAIPVLNHRLALKAEASLEGLTTTIIINRILDSIPVPM